MSSGVTINGAEAKLSSFFKGIEGDFVSVETIFKSENRDPVSPKDRNWFYNYNSILKKFDLANPLRGKKNGSVVTLGLTLTDKGRAALRRNETRRVPLVKEVPPIAAPHQREVTLASWRADAYALQDEHPELVITFDVRMRRGDE